MNNFKDVLKNTILAEQNALSIMYESLDYDVLQNVAKKIADCKGSIILSGCGSSGVVAERATCILNFVYRPSHFLSPTDAFHGDIGMIRKGDIYIPISKGGNSKELVDAIPIARRLGAFIIGVTQNSDSYIANESDMVVLLKSGEEAEGIGGVSATCSSTAVSVLFDSIAMCVIQMNGIQQKDFALIHPGGAVGKKLNMDYSNEVL